MKRLTTLATVLIVAVIACSAQQPIQRRFGAPTFYGPVRTVRIERAEITSQNGQLTEGPRTLLQTVAFNKDGTRKELTVYRSDGAISGRTIETFGPDGRLLETKTFRGNGDLGNWTARVYDENKKLIEQITYRPDGSVSHRTTFVYQDNKRIHKSVAYDQNGVIVSQVDGVLDLKTHRMQTITQNPAGVVQRETAFTDTSDGQVYQEQTNGTPTRRSLTRPLKTGGAEMIDYDQDGVVRTRQRVKSEVDSYGNFIKEVNLVARGDSGDFQPAGVIYRTFEYYGKN
jgi:antitoxin component YwqK of YwqJK toxin-antitoxin module